MAKFEKPVQIDLRIQGRAVQMTRNTEGELVLRIDCEVHTASGWKKDGLPIIVRQITGLRDAFTNDHVLALMVADDEQTAKNIADLVAKKKNANAYELESAAWHYAVLLHLIAIGEESIRQVEKPKPAAQKKTAAQKAADTKKAKAGAKK